MGVELEFKLSIPEEYASALESSAFIQTRAEGEAQVHQLRTTYYDTTDLKLRKSRQLLRVRRSGTAWFQTVKSGGRTDGGLHQRDEWEVSIAGPAPEFNRMLGVPGLELFLNPELQKALHPVFVTEFERRSWIVKMSPKDDLEVSLDRGVVRAGERSTPLCEIELELKHGSPECVRRAAEELMIELPRAKPETVNKARRGYALLAE